MFNNFAKYEVCSLNYFRKESLKRELRNYLNSNHKKEHKTLRMNQIIFEILYKEYTDIEI